MKQDKAEKIIKKAELKAQKAAQQVQVASKKAEAAAKKQEERREKKASKAAQNATKKAEKKTKKAEVAAKKAQLAAKKAEEKKAKIAAKVSSAKKGGEAGEGQTAPKKKGKKKLILIALPVLAAAVAGGAFFFLKGGDKEKEEAPPEPIAAPAEYVLNESHISALPVWGSDVLVYQEEIKPEPPAEEKQEGEATAGEENAGENQEAPAEEAGGEAFTKILYRYEGLQAPGQLAAAYIALMTTEDAGFSVVDETLLQIDPPDLEGKSSGSVQLARNVPSGEDGTGGGVHSLLLNWNGNSCTVTLDMPEGRVHSPQPETTPLAPRRGLADLETMHPSKLGLAGESMEEYELMLQDGAVRIAGSPCQRVNIYDANSQIAGSYFISTDGHLYKLDESSNAVVELDWE